MQKISELLPWGDIPSGPLRPDDIAYYYYEATFPLGYKVEYNEILRIVTGESRRGDTIFCRDSWLMASEIQELRA